MIFYGGPYNDMTEWRQISAIIDAVANGTTPPAMTTTIDYWLELGAGLAALPVASNPAQLSSGTTAAELDAVLADPLFGDLVILPSGTTVLDVVPHFVRSVDFQGHADGTSELLVNGDMVDGSTGTSHTLSLGKDSSTIVPWIKLSNFTIRHNRAASPDMRSAAIDMYYRVGDLIVDNVTGINITSDFFLGRPYPWWLAGCNSVLIQNCPVNGVWEGTINWHAGPLVKGRVYNVQMTESTFHAGYQGPMGIELNIEQAGGLVEDFEASNCSFALTDAAYQVGGSIGFVENANVPKAPICYERVRVSRCTFDGFATGLYFPAPNYTEGAVGTQESLAVLTDNQVLNCAVAAHVYPDSNERPAGAIVSNVCVRSGGALSYAHWNTSFAADQECYAKITNITGIELFVRAQAKSIFADNYEVYFADTTTAQIWKRVRGDASVIGADIAITHSANDEWKIRATGDPVVTIELFKNGSLVATRTDGDITGAGYIGRAIAGATSSIDDFGGGAVSTTALLDDFNRADEDPVDPTNWTASGSWRTGSPNDRIVLIRNTGNTNAPTIDQSRLTAGDIYVDEIDNTWT